MNSTATKERPILFKAEMVRAILEGRKTQTRRIVKPQPEGELSKAMDLLTGLEAWIIPAKGSIECKSYRCPYGVPGDLLWVKEAWEGIDEKNKDLTIYKATADMGGERVTWKSPLFMPRWASRITLEIVSIGVERLKDISAEDCIAEGVLTDQEYNDRAGEGNLWPCLACDGYQVYSKQSLMGAHEVDCRGCDTVIKRYRALWESINGNGSWDANPWVWVIEFKKVKP